MTNVNSISMHSGNMIVSSTIRDIDRTKLESLLRKTERILHFLSIELTASRVSKSISLYQRKVLVISNVISRRNCNPGFFILTLRNPSTILLQNFVSEPQ